MNQKQREEIGEIAEILNKKTGRKAGDDNSLQEQLGFELVDALHYIDAIAPVDGLDLQRMVLEKDKLAIFTGIYTGDGERTWIFYTRNIPAFGRTLNEALAPFETLPLTIYTEKDPEWNEYREMCELQGQEGEDDDCDDNEI